MSNNQSDNDLPDDNLSLNAKKIRKNKIKVKKSREERFNHAWWLPLLALLVTTYFVVNHFTSKGTLISISFASAEGLEVKKTKIKYKDVVIGKVESIYFNEGFNGVMVNARMDRKSEELLREDTRFWIVKPRLSVTQITGLNTIISGTYITLDPSKEKNSAYNYEFKGLDRPPVISLEDAGKKIRLSSGKASLLSEGTSVYYKGIKVGQVGSVDLTEDKLGVVADVFIKSPHDKLVKPTTLFWSASGVTFGSGAEGLEVSIESIEALLGGGIAFETDPSLLNRDDLEVQEETEFTLFDNKKRALEQEVGRVFYFVSYFDGNVKGLKIGAPVTVQGMKIGIVKEISLQFDEDLFNARVSVLFEIYESRFRRISTAATDNQIANQSELKNFIEKLMSKGLSTQLETGNLLTGTKQISLVFEEKNQKLPIKLDPLTQFTLMPSIPNSFDAITDGITGFVQKINELPLEKITKDISKLIATANKQVKRIPLAEIGYNLNNVLMTANSKLDKVELNQFIKRLSSLVATTDRQLAKLPLNKTAAALNALLKEGKTLASTAKSSLLSINKTVSDLSKTAQNVVVGYSADAPLYHNANLSMEQLNETMTSLKTVLDMLDRHPSSLVFGEEKPKNPQQSYWESPNAKE